MLTFNHLSRRVSIEHSRGELTVRIGPSNRQMFYVFALVWITFGTGFFTLSFRGPLMHSGFSMNGLPALLVVISLIGIYFVVMRALIWRAFGVDEIFVQDGRLQWTSRALWLKQELELPVGEISDVKAVTPWDSLRNHVEFTSGTRRYIVGDALLHDETTELALALKHALGLR